MRAKKIRKAEPISAPSWYRKKQKNDLKKQLHEQQIRENSFEAVFSIEILKGVEDGNS